MRKISLAILIQFSFWIVSVAFAAGTYFHTQETVNKRVLEVERNSDLNSKIICYIAIDLGVEKAKNICTRSILNQ